MKIQLTGFSVGIAVIALTTKGLAGDSFEPYTNRDQVPQTAQQLWAQYDASTEPLDIEVVKEWNNGDVTTRYVTFTVGTFKGQPARIAAYYSFPNLGGSHPAFVWSHGGGQRAERQRGVYFARQGYATVDINWLGRPMEDDIEVNTDWGRVDPTQGPQFYPKALRSSWKLNLEPDEYTIDQVTSPRNSNWFLLSVAGRRAITFLELQPEVDSARIGFAGYSMGGMVTALCATDKRLRAVAPFVGGSGFKHIDFIGGIVGSSLRRQIGDNVDFYSRTIDASAYWPNVNVPVLFVSSSNDFHSTFERIYQSMHLLGHADWRVTTNLHQNHGPGPQQWGLLNLWFDRYLKGQEVAIPKSPLTRVVRRDGDTVFSVSPDLVDRLDSTSIYYSHDPNSRTRFWVSADVVRSAAGFEAKIPIRAGLPTFAFATCTYKLPEVVDLQNGQTDTISINSDEFLHIPDQLDLRLRQHLAETNVLIESASDIAENWSSRDGKTIKTYQLQSPFLNFSPASKMKLFVDHASKRMSIRIKVSGKFLDRKLSQGDYQAVKLIESDSGNVVTLGPADFKGDSSVRMDWTKVATLEITLIDLEARDAVRLYPPNDSHYLKRIEFVN